MNQVTWVGVVVSCLFLACFSGVQRSFLLPVRTDASGSVRQEDLDQRIREAGPSIGEIERLLLHLDHRISQVTAKLTAVKASIVQQLAVLRSSSCLGRHQGNMSAQFSRL